MVTHIGPMLIYAKICMSNVSIKVYKLDMMVACD